VNREELRAAILSADDLPREAVTVPWVEEKLYVRGLTAAERDEWMASSSPDGEMRWTPNLTADLVVKTLITEDGERLFTDGDAPALGQKGSLTLSELFNVAMRLSGLTAEAQEEIGAGFGVAQSGASSSG
jgi:hypothetical protein